MLIGITLFGLLAAIAWLHWHAVTRWDGPWRMLAAIPAALLAGDVLWIIADVSIDSTARNLWPLELLLIGACGAGFIAVLWLARMVVRRA
jgi:hypothetical protein